MIDIWSYVFKPAAELTPDLAFGTGNLSRMLKGCYWKKMVLAFNSMGASILLILVLQALGPAAQVSPSVVLRVSGAVSQPLRFAWCRASRLSRYLDFVEATPWDTIKFIAVRPAERFLRSGGCLGFATHAHRIIGKH